jgi:hypothetical protein
MSQRTCLVLLSCAGITETMVLQLHLDCIMNLPFDPACENDFLRKNILRLHITGCPIVVVIRCHDGGRGERGFWQILVSSRSVFHVRGCWTGVARYGKRKVQDDHLSLRDTPPELNYGRALD